jgi:hypothetical protein
MTFRPALTLALALTFYGLTSSVANALDNCPVFYGIYCIESATLDTDFGPIVRVSQVSEDGRARYGFYSALTKEYNWTTDWMTIYNRDVFAVRDVNSTSDSFIPNLVRGVISVQSDFGPVVWATQLVEISVEGMEGKATLGRWGIYNLLTKTFYPEAEHDWKPAHYR